MALTTYKLSKLKAILFSREVLMVVEKRRRKKKKRPASKIKQSSVPGYCIAAASASGSGSCAFFHYL